ncbi:GPI biosynthesis protein family Pig-F-domain-containing protein [Cubamyces lactineus]|nr:GPI biosynthesis protein family Pig-F-domain-containing protein [Cubamyces lactineus]
MPRTMPTRKTKTATASKAPAQQQTTVSLETDSFFPFARYTSLVGVHTSLLAFSALLLPTTPTSLLLKGVSIIPSSGRDAATQPRRDVVQVLTENPVRTVAWICAGVLILQGWWASWVKTWSLDMRSTAKTAATLNNAEATKQKLERKGGSYEQIVVRILEAIPQSVRNDRTLLQVFGKAAAMTVMASMLFHVVAVLFGAPISSHPLHTYMMSLLLAILTVLPPAYTLGVPSLGSDSPSLVSRLTWIRLFAELSPRNPVERALVYPAIGAMIGCWAGAIPIGLDWERPWQAWPLTPAFGAVGGCIAGSLIALVVSAILAFAQVDRQAQQAQAQAGIAKKS